MPKNTKNLTITWTPSDVQSLTNLSDEGAAIWLADNEKHIRERLVELSWGVFESPLIYDGIELKNQN